MNSKEIARIIVNAAAVLTLGIAVKHGISADYFGGAFWLAVSYLLVSRP